MEIEQWWSGLDSKTQQWLFDHNGEAISSEVLVRIVEAGGPAMTDAWWSHEDGPTGFFLPDEAVDWVETWPTTSTTPREPDVSDAEAPNREDASGRRTGRWAEHDPHGGTIVGDYLEGERTGEWTHSFADGRVRSVSQYVAGRLSGPATWYRATGGLLQTGGFVDGEKHGLWRRWNTAGELLDEGEFDHGRKTGRWTSFNPDGTVKRTTMHRVRASRNDDDA